jgi:phosphoadenosine phosphosulfate reductase
MISTSPDLEETLNLEAASRRLAAADALELVEWGVEYFGDGLVVSSHFGIRSSAMLHLATRVVPDIPVVWVDTGYLPAEIYRFAETTIERLQLNIKVYQSPLTPARMEALYGLEQQDVSSLHYYDRIRKEEPLCRALQELAATAWLAEGSAERLGPHQEGNRLERKSTLYTLYPLLYWSTAEVAEYMRAHNLPCHPFFPEGDAAVADRQSHRSV